MTLDKIIAETFKPEEKLVLPQDLPCNENAEFLELTERGTRELQNYDQRRGRKSIMIKAVRDIEPKIKNNEITVENAIRELRGCTGEGDWSLGYASQRVQELLDEGSLKGDPWFLKFDIKREDYLRLMEVVKGGPTSLSSLATLFNAPKEKIRKMGGVLAKRGFILAFPGTVEDYFYSYRELSKKDMDAPAEFDYLTTSVKPIIFLDSRGEESKEVFLPIEMKQQGIETANNNYMDRALLNNLQKIEEGKLKIPGRKITPTVDGMIGPVISNSSSPKKVRNLALDYVPNLQMLSLIDYDVDSLKNILTKEEFESINRSPWCKRRFDMISKDDKKKTWDDSRRGKYHNDLFEKHEAKVRQTIQKAKQFFPYFNPPEFNGSDENRNKSAYLFFVAYNSKFASEYMKDQMSFWGVFKPELDKVGVVKLTENGKKVLESGSPVLPHVEITYSKPKF